MSSSLDSPAAARESQPPRGRRGGRTHARIRVLLVDRHAMFAQGLARLLDDEPDLVPVGFASDVHDAAEIAGRSSPDVVLFDMELGRDDLAHAIATVRTSAPGARVLLLTGAASEDGLQEAPGLGVDGVGSKRWDIDTLVDKIRRVAAGEEMRVDAPTTAPARPSSSLAARRSSTPAGRGGSIPGSRTARLTPRELEILAALVSGRSTVEIAAGLGISPLTVRSHVKSVLVKLGVHSKLEAVTLAIRNGLIPLDRTA